MLREFKAKKTFHEHNLWIFDDNATEHRSRGAWRDEFDLYGKYPPGVFSYHIPFTQ